MPESAPASALAWKVTEDLGAPKESTFQPHKLMKLPHARQRSYYPAHLAAAGRKWRQKHDHAEEYACRPVGR